MQVCTNTALHEHGLLRCCVFGAPHHQPEKKACWEQETWLQPSWTCLLRAVRPGTYSWGMVPYVQDVACRPLSKTVRFNVLRVIPAGALQKKAFATF